MDGLKEVQYFDSTIYWTDELDGCGNTMVDDFLDATAYITNNKHFNNTLEMFSGPGYWGFGLLFSQMTDKLTLSDIELKNSYVINKTIRENKVETKAKFVNTSTFSSLKEEKFDLIVGNPPHFNHDPYVEHYSEPRKYKDLDWSIHKSFFENVGNYLTNDGTIILAENVWGSRPTTFKHMIDDADLQIIDHFKSKQYPLDMWYLAVTRKTAER